MNFLIVADYDYSTAFGVCVVCRTPRRDGEQIVNTGSEVDEGFVAICSTCISYMNGLIGGVTPQQQAMMNADLTAMSLEVERARRFMADYERSKAAVKAEHDALRKTLATVRGIDAENRKAKASA